MSDNNEEPRDQWIPVKLADQAIRVRDAEIAELKYLVSQLNERCEALREAGDEIWYCYRHRENLSEAMSEWVEVRDQKFRS